MSGDVQVRFCESLRVRSPRATRLVFVFQHKKEAERFYRVLPKRLGKYGLSLHEEKSQLIPSGRTAAARAKAQGGRLPTYKFLGFICYWGKSRKGFMRLKYSSRKDRFNAKLKGIRDYLRENLTTKNTPEVITQVVLIVRGWINYNGISDNDKRVSAFIEISKRMLLRWFNRRGKVNCMTWKKLALILKRYNYPKQWKTISMF